MDVIQVFFALVLATIGVSQASALASDATKARESAISIFSILDRKSKIDSSSNDGMVPENVTGNIDFNNVSFKYPSRPDVQIFSDFTLHIPSGKVLLNSLYVHPFVRFLALGWPQIIGYSVSCSVAIHMEPSAALFQVWCFPSTRTA